MPRGHKANEGDKMVAANGYHYVRTETGWRLTHHVVAELHLGRRLLPTEMARFKDGNKENFDSDNIVVITKGTVSLRQRLARIEAQIEELVAQRDLLIAELKETSS